MKKLLVAVLLSLGLSSVAHAAYQIQFEVVTFQYDATLGQIYDDGGAAKGAADPLVNVIYGSVDSGGDFSQIGSLANVALDFLIDVDPIAAPVGAIAGTSQFFNVINTSTGGYYLELAPANILGLAATFSGTGNSFVLNVSDALILSQALPYVADQPVAFAFGGQVASAVTSGGFYSSFSAAGEGSVTTAVPEPGILSLIGIAFLGLGVAKRRSIVKI